MPDSDNSIDLGALDAAVAGDAVGPGDDGWDVARHAWNLVADQQPLAVVLAEGADDVLATVGFAREHGARVAVQSTGHGAAAISSLENTILLRTARMAGVEIDAGSRTARVEAGALWGDVGRRAAEHGLVGLHGSAAEVGVVGYTLGGGHGWLGRLHGLAANSVLSLDVVTADGRRVRAAHDSEPELFWALRGGGGSFGVVTAMEFSLYPLSEAYAGMIAWPADRGAEVFSLYREWTGGFPEEMSAWARFLTLPPLPEVPEPLRARPVVDITAAYAGPEEEGAELLKPLRELGDPVVDTFGAIPGAGLSAINGDPEEPVPGIGDGDLLRELSPDAVAALVEVAGADSGSPLLMVQLRQLGGALARASDDGGATSKLDADFAMYSVGVAMGPDVSRAVEAHVKRVREELRPWTAPTRYLNFVDAPAAAAQSFDPETFSRLQRVKAQYDPSGTFRANHEVDAAV